MTTSLAHKSILTNPLPAEQRKAAARLPQQHFVPNFKDKIKSRAGCQMMEFLNRVFCSEGASRFFKTFLLRFLFDTSQSGEDCSGSPMPVLS